MTAAGPAAAGSRVDVTLAAAPPAGWDALCAGDPAATFFHSRLWSEALARHVPGVAPLWLCARVAGRFVGGLPAVARRRGPLRFLQGHFEGTVAGPLLAAGLPPGERDAIAVALLDAWSRQARRPGVMAASLVLPAAADAGWGGTLAARGWARREQSAAVLALDGGVEAVEYGVFPKNRRNERNRALRRGCTAGVTDDPAVLAAYYPIYRAAARRWGVRPTPEALLRDLLARGGDAVFLSWVRQGERVIGGHVCFRHGDEVVAWNGATLPEQAELFPATLLIWTDIVAACRLGARRLDLGGSAGIASLALFKERVGARPQTRGLYELATPLYRALRRLRGGGADASPPRAPASGQAEAPA